MNSESNFWKHLLRDFCWRNLIKMKVEAKEREKSHRFSFFLVEGLNWLLLIGKFCASPVIMWRKMQMTFILTCFAKYDFFVDFFVVTNQANYQDYSGIYSWGRHCISWSYTRTPRFLYLRTAFGHLSGLQKHPFLLALRRRGRAKRPQRRRARRHGCFCWLSFISRKVLSKYVSV